MGQLPVFDLGPFLEKCVVKGEDVDEELKKQCVALAQCLKDTSALVVKDPRCPSHDNATFLNMLEKYYAQPGESRSSASRSPRGPRVCSRSDFPRLSPAPSSPPSTWKRAEDVKRADERPHFHYQVGVTPEGVEVPRCSMDPSCIEEIKKQPEGKSATR